MVLMEQRLPAGVAQLRRQAGRPDDVGEQDGGEDAVGLGRVPAWIGAALGLVSAFVNLVRLTSRASR